MTPNQGLSEQINSTGIFPVIEQPPLLRSWWRMFFAITFYAQGFGLQSHAKLFSYPDNPTETYSLL